MSLNLTFLPGEFWIERGRGRNYTTLSRFHYLPKRPATGYRVWTIRYRAPGAVPRIVAVAVLSYPTRLSIARRSALDLKTGWNGQVRFANRHVRTISRVIVHPTFRALGLSSALVRFVCNHCPTRYCEATAMMGRAHPFFERGGMRRYEPIAPDRPVYYLYRRHPTRRTARMVHPRKSLLAPSLVTGAGRRSAITPRKRRG